MSESVLSQSTTLVVILAEVQGNHSGHELLPGIFWDISSYAFGKIPFKVGCAQVLQALSAAAVIDTNIPEAPFISTSPGFTSLMGYESHEVLRISNLCLCGPNTNKTTKQKLISAHYHTKPCEVQILWYKKDGTPVWVYVYCCPMVPPDAIQARPCHHLNILLDVTSTRPSRIGKHIMGRVIGSGASGIVRIGKSTISGTLWYPCWI